MFPINQYIKIARPDHWFKNIFVLPGFLFALLETNNIDGYHINKLIIGLLSACLIASANYVINEWLDSKFDKFHPTKKIRPLVVGKINRNIIYSEYFVLAFVGLLLAHYIGYKFFVTAIIFLVMGFIYNVNPIRTKDIAYIDVLSESINNPIRLLLGWFVVNNVVLPPISLILGYWMAGAFLMAIKRFAEYRTVGAVAAQAYRKSFRHYTENSLLTASFFYAMCSTFFLGIYLIKYKLELIISFPFLCLLFSWYLYIGLQEDSLAQTPEKLIKSAGFLSYALLLFVLVVILINIEIPQLESIFNL